MAKTIGIIIDQLVYEYQAEFWHGICHQAQESGVNIVSYVGSTVDSSDEAYSNQNKVYDLISRRRVDGSIVLISSVASRINKTEKTEFMKKIASRCPVLSVGDIFKEYPSVGVDNRKGMYDSVNHLISRHGKKRIAFIGGPSSSDEATARFNAYKEALKANSIQYDEKLFYLGNFVFDSGIDAVRYLVSNKVSFDAVVAASDWMIFGAMQELKQQGFEIPGEIAVSGFDNVESAYVSIPSLSSVKQPVYEMGRKVVSMMLDVIEKRDYAQCTLFPTEHVIRDSCGCLLVDTKTEMESGVRAEDDKSVSGDELKQTLFDKLKTDIIHTDSTEFLNLFNSSLERITRAEEITEFQNMISDIRDTILSPESLSAMGISSPEQMTKHRYIRSKDVEKIFDMYGDSIRSVENILHKARALVTRRAEQLQFIKYLDVNNKSSQIINIGQRLLTSYNRDFMFSVIKRDFPSVDISSCAIIEYVEPQAVPVSKMARMIFHYHKDKEVKITDDPFESETLVPDAYWPVESSSPWILTVLPLTYKKTAIGYVLFESKNLFGLVYEAFSSEIASALKGIEIYEEHDKIAASIKDRSVKINALVAPMLESIMQVAHLSGNEVETIKDLSNITSDGLTLLQKANAIIGKAAESINQMLDMISMIEDLSENINILALNASIESARAGSYGLGFQVIAQEVKHLSDSTAQNIKSISDVLRKVVSNIEESSRASKENYKVFTNVKNHVDQVTNLLMNITNKMNELSTSSNDILTEIDKKI